MMSKPLSYCAVNAVLCHLSVYRRLELLRTAPSIAPTLQLIPLRLESLSLNGMELQINNIRYQFVIAKADENVMDDSKNNVKMDHDYLPHTEEPAAKKAKLTDVQEELFINLIVTTPSGSRIERIGTENRLKEAMTHLLQKLFGKRKVVSAKTLEIADGHMMECLPAGPKFQVKNLNTKMVNLTAFIEFVNSRIHESSFPINTLIVPNWSYLVVDSHELFPKTNRMFLPNTDLLIVASGFYSHKNVHVFFDNHHDGACKIESVVAFWTKRNLKIGTSLSVHFKSMKAANMARAQIVSRFTECVIDKDRSVYIEIENISPKFMAITCKAFQETISGDTFHAVLQIETVDFCPKTN